MKDLSNFANEYQLPKTVIFKLNPINKESNCMSEEEPSIDFDKANENQQKTTEENTSSTEGFENALDLIEEFDNLINDLNTQEPSSTNNTSKSSEDELNDLGIFEDLPQLGFETTTPTILTDLLVAPNEIDITTQKEMVDSLIFIRLTNILDGKKTYKEAIQSVLVERLTKLITATKKLKEENPNSPLMDNAIRAVRTIQSLIKNYDKLSTKADEQLVSILGYTKTSDLELLLSEIIIY